MQNPSPVLSLTVRQLRVLRELAARRDCHLPRTPLPVQALWELTAKSACFHVRIPFSSFRSLPPPSQPA